MGVEKLKESSDELVFSLLSAHDLRINSFLKLAFSATKSFAWL